MVCGLTVWEESTYEETKEVDEVWTAGSCWKRGMVTTSRSRERFVRWTAFDQHASYTTSKLLSDHSSVIMFLMLRKTSYVPQRNGFETEFLRALNILCTQCIELLRHLRGLMVGLALKK